MLLLFFMLFLLWPRDARASRNNNKQHTGQTNDMRNVCETLFLMYVLLLLFNLFLIPSRHARASRKTKTNNQRIIAIWLYGSMFLCLFLFYHAARGE